MARYTSPETVNWSAGVGEGLKYVNTVTDSVFSNFLLLVIAVIFASGYYAIKRDALGSVVLGSFMAWMIAVIFFVGEFVGWISLSITTAFMILMFGIMYFQNN